MALQKAKLVNVSVTGEPSVEVLFNPTDYSLDRGSSYASMPVPGLQTPIQQYIRGEADVLTLDLFIDGTQDTDASKVNQRLEDLRRFIRIDGALHAPPVCRFEWGDLHFTGTVTSLREKLTLFDPGGGVRRARVLVTLRAYKSAEVQRRELKLSSPDRTHVRVLREGETLSSIAAEVYGDPRLWRPIALANGVDRPRAVKPGTPLKIPAL
jgi:hypothetical protein